MTNMVNSKYNLYLNSLKSSVTNNQADSGDFSSVLNSVMSNTETTNLDAIFEEAAEKYNVPSNLLKAVAKAESGFDPNAQSGAGAQGIMQLMPATAKSLGVTDPFDAEQNIMGGAKYLSQMLARYNGNTVLALAAYNAGPGNVAKYDGVPPFAETQKYVTKVIGYMRDNVSAGTVTQKSDDNADAEDISKLAAIKDTRQLLQNLDPQLQSDKESLYGMDYGLMMNIYQYKYKLQSSLIKALDEET